MENDIIKTLSDKAKVVLAAMRVLDANGEEKKVTSYAIFDIIVDDEDLSKQELLKDVTEEELNNIIIDTNIKSINTLLASLIRKGLVGKTAPNSITVEGTTRNLRQYFIK